MNTANMPEEEEIDRLFRQAAESYEPEFEPEAWRTLEQKLDAALAPRSAFRRWGREALVLLLVGLTGLFIYLQTHNRESKPVKNEKVVLKKEAEQVAGGLPAGNSEKQPGAAPALKQKYTIAPALPKKGSVGNKTSKMPPGAITKNNLPAGQGRLSPAANEYQPLSAENEESESTVTGEGNDNSTLTIKPPDVTKADPAERQPLQFAGENQAPAAVPRDSIVKAGENKSGAGEKEASLSQEASKAAAITDSIVRPLRKRWMAKLSIHLVLGPDLSTVGFVRPEAASTNVGGLLSYELTNRWAVSTGVLRARKVYGAKPEDYQPGDGYWYGRHLPDDINAVCQVLDIPINIRYNVIAKRRQAVYVQTGLSSYLMLNEDYRYDYKNYGNPYSQHWVVANRNKHILGVANVALGYSYQLGPGIALGVEPFAKIPLTGIGAGKVNLTSLGALFSLGYHFP